MVRDTLAFGGAQFLARVLNFGYFLILARMLDVEAFGVLSFAISILILIDIVIDVGLSRHGAREIAKSEGEIVAFLGVVLPFKIVAALAALVTMAGLSLLSDWARPHAMIFVACALSAPVLAASMAFDAVLQGRGRFSALASAHLMLSVLQAALGLIVLAVGAGATTVALTLLASNTAFCLVVGRNALRLSPGPPSRFHIAALAARLPDAAPYMISALIVMMSIRAELIILGWFGTPADLGAFSVATRIMEATLLLPLAVGGVMAPRFARMHLGDGDALAHGYRRTVEPLLVAAVPLAALAHACAPLAPWLLGEGYRSAALYLSWLYIGYPAACLLHLNIFLMLSASRQGGPLATLSVLGLGQVAVNLALQAQFGAAGATAAFVVTMFAGALITSAFVAHAYLGSRAVIAALRKPALCAAAATAGAALVAAPWSGMAAIIFGTLAALAIYGPTVLDFIRSSRYLA